MKTAPIIDGDELLAHGFASHVLHWATEAAEAAGREFDARAQQLLRQAAFHASLATANGHACALLTEILDDPGEDATGARQRLLASGCVGTPEQPGAMPLILDQAGRLYLHRYFDYERRLARRLLAPSQPAAVGSSARAQLDALFAANQALLAGRPDWQKIAAALALRQPLTIISGGPGTGKTTTVVNMLACLLTQTPDCRVALAAPTGKAAARMLEALRARAGHLPPELAAALPQQSYTVHRLLGATAEPGVFRHHADNPLALDLLVVDEASMLDLALAVKLFEAVPPTARIILLGDKDQLAAVESGAVFAELCADPSLSPQCIAELAALTGIPAETIRPAPAQKTTGLRDSVVWFADNFRFHADSGIGRLAAGIGAGAPQPLLDWLAAQDGGEVGWRDDDAAQLSAATLEAILAGCADYFAAARQASAEQPGAAFERFAAFRVLCALRHGGRGALAVNDAVTARARPLLGAAGGDDWYPGRPVMVTRNDYALRLFNGDIGIALPDADGALKVCFPEPDGGFRLLTPARLPPHDTAFALTVHKSQGSEFENVLLLLPHQPNRVVTRELLYTGVTRARARIALAAPAAVLAQAVATPTVRHSGLLQRIGEIAGHG